jgi:hypothetical protein
LRPAALEWFDAVSDTGDGVVAKYRVEDAPIGGTTSFVAQSMALRMRRCGSKPAKHALERCTPCPASASIARSSRLCCQQPDDLGNLLRSEIARYAKLVKETALKIQ